MSEPCMCGGEDRCHKPVFDSRDEEVERIVTDLRTDGQMEAANLIESQQRTMRLAINEYQDLWRKKDYWMAKAYSADAKASAYESSAERAIGRAKIKGLFAGAVITLLVVGISTMLFAMTIA